MAWNALKKGMRPNQSLQPTRSASGHHFSKPACHRAAELNTLAGNFIRGHMKKFFLLIMFTCAAFPLKKATAGMKMDVSDDRMGLFIGAAESRDPRTLGLELGANAFMGSVCSVNGSLVLLGHQHSNESLAGFKLGVRAETPTRIAPFIGLGGFYGYSEVSKDADSDDLDNDHDGSVDEIGEQVTSSSDDLATIFPEIGIHLWVTEAARFSLSYAYNFSSWGRRSDYKVIGLNFGLVFEGP